MLAASAVESRGHHSVTWPSLSVSQLCASGLAPDPLGWKDVQESGRGGGYWFQAALPGTLLEAE